MNVIDHPGFHIILELILFMVLTAVGSVIVKRIRNSDNRYTNPQEFLPEDEIHTLRQVFYLIMMSLCFVVVLYTIMGFDLFYISLFDIFLSWFIAVTLDKVSTKNKILLVILVPFGSMTYLLYGYTIVGVIDFIHVPVFIYFIKVYYDKFNNYTVSHGLSLAIILLFTIVFFSFF